MAHGPGKSRFLYDEKMHLAKNVPLGELIYLDRERCIQCARCIRFQDEIAGDPVLGFDERGRAMQIVSLSEPGFDSVFSGNTTDICPVGALTTADFRFGARPWELSAVGLDLRAVPGGLQHHVQHAPRSQGRRRDRDQARHAAPERRGQRDLDVRQGPLCLSLRGKRGAARRKPLVRKEGKLARASWEAATRSAGEAFAKARQESAGAGFRPALE